MQRARDVGNRRRRSRATTPLYGAAVTGLTVFFLGLVLLRPPQTQYMVGAELGWGQGRSAEASPLAAAALSDAVAYLSGSAADWRFQVAAAVDRADRRLTPSNGGTNQTNGLAPIDSALPPVRIHLIPDAGPNPRVRVTCWGEDPIRLVAIVEELTEGLLTAASPGPPTELAGIDRAITLAQWRVDQARHYVRKARFDLERFAGDEGIDALAGGDRPPDGDAMSDRDEITPASAALIVNPTWQRLQDELAELASKYHQLTSNYTPHHPLAQNLLLEMEAIQRQLATTPQRVAGGAEGVWGWSPPAVPASRTVPIDRRGANRSVSARQAASSDPAMPAARLQYAETVRLCEAAEAELHRLLTRRETVQADRQALTGYVASPAAVVDRLGGRLRPAHVVLLGVLALTSGMAMGWLVSVVRGSSGTDLASPTVPGAAIPEGTWPWGDRARRGRPGEQFVGRLLATCEWTLVTLVALLLVAAVSDGSLSARMSVDPFGAVGETVASVVRGGTD